MPLGFLNRAFRFLVKSQIWIGICAWASAASSYSMVKNQFMPWYWGLLIGLIVMSTYAWYYISNPEFPLSRNIAICGSLFSLGLYIYLGFPNLVLVFCIIVLSAIYMLPQGKKNKIKLLIRWFILTLVWTLFTFNFPLLQNQQDLKTALYFVYRFLFIGNLCYLFLIKDESHIFTRTSISFFRNILIIAQGLAISSIWWYFSEPLAYLMLIPYLLIFLFYKKQRPNSGVYFYSLGIDGLLVLESIFVQSLFLYGL